MEKSPFVTEEISRLHPDKIIGISLEMTVFRVGSSKCKFNWPKRSHKPSPKGVFLAKFPAIKQSLFKNIDSVVPIV
jgi:hypothetical protein